MKIKRFFICVIFFLALITDIYPASHYSLEHAEELKNSGKIEWRDYGLEAFNEALKDNKPVFLLLTAPSWCYWCHVYSSDDFIYHPAVYPIINRDFIPVYVDADKRQDLARQYLEGGWPSTTIMTPHRIRIYGYSGTRPVGNMIDNMKRAIAFVKTRKQAGPGTDDYVRTKITIPTVKQVRWFFEGYIDYMLEVYDPIHGGFGREQKFPQGKTLDFALDMYDLTGKKKFIKIVKNTLKNQYTGINRIKTDYNLYDPVEGGFHRYGTRRNWTPPHYEKMLSTNALLLRAYSHLLKKNPGDHLAREVVNKTIEYIEKNWYDNDQGGFFGNTDVHGEEHYYGNINRPAVKPRIEKTRYSDWNAEMIITYLQLWKTTGNERYKKMAEKTLNFYAKEIITETGAYHYMKHDGSKHVRGNLPDNAYLLLAFITGYNITGNPEHLKTAKKIAEYLLDNLYDWNSGGFFERNSREKKIYAPGENILLSKPVEANGIVSHAFLKIYKLTGEPTYLNAGVKSFAAAYKDSTGLDAGYYFAKSARLILKEKLLIEYRKLEDRINEIEKKKLVNFWVNSPGKSIDGFTVSTGGADNARGPLILLMMVSLIAGIVSFASPCSLPILPAYLAYSFNTSEKYILGMTFAFFTGQAGVFALLGVSASFAGSYIKDHVEIFTKIAGVAVVFFGVFMILGKGFRGFHIRKTKPATYFGSFLFGSVMGISWTPCVGPILAALLLIASSTGSAFSGGFLLFSYAAGLGIPLILLSAYIDRVDKDSRLWKIISGKAFTFRIFKRDLFMHSGTLLSGIIFIILGYSIFSGTLFSLNKYISTGSFQKIFFTLEDWLLNIIK